MHTYILNVAWWIGRSKKISIKSEASFYMDWTGQGEDRFLAVRNIISKEMGYG